MKKRYINLLTVVFSSTVILGGCGGTRIYSASAADPSEMSSQVSEDSVSDPVEITSGGSGKSSSDTSEMTSQKSGDSDSGVAEKNAQVTDKSGSESADESSSENELFTDRDLSGEYDSEEAVKVVLNKTSIECSNEGVEVSGSNAAITKAGDFAVANNSIQR